MQLRAGQVAVVTGAASGIGRATSIELARRGLDLALVDRDQKGAEQTARQVEQAGRRADVFVVDVADREQMATLPERVRSRFPGVHVLVNNAGVSLEGPFRELALADVDWIVGINFWGVWYGCHFFLPVLERQPAAHIVNVSSMFGFAGIPRHSAYCATKFAVRGMSEALEAELRAAGSGVGVTCVHPGGFATAISRDARNTDDSARAAGNELLSKMGDPAAAGRAIVRAIERGRTRLRLRPESYALDWAKRIAPVSTQRLVTRVLRRAGLA